MKKLTSITILDRAEGITVSYTYSTINEDGQITERNVRKSYIVMNEEELNIIKQIKEKVDLKLQANN